MWMRQKTRREIRDQTAETQSLDKLTFKSDPPSLWKVCERKRIVRAQWVSGIECFSICVQVRASVYSVRSRKPACTCLSERKRLSFTNTIPSLTLWGCSLLPPSRVGGREAGRALLVLRRLDYGGHDHLLPRCGRVTGVTEILVLESWGWKNWWLNSLVTLSGLLGSGGADSPSSLRDLSSPLIFCSASSSSEQRARSLSSAAFMSLYCRGTGWMGGTGETWPWLWPWAWAWAAMAASKSSRRRPNRPWHVKTNILVTCHIIREWIHPS